MSRSLTLPFDEVYVEGAGTKRRYDAHRFLELPLDQRIGMILRGKVTFFLEGRPVPPLEALRALREWSVG